MRYLKLSIEGGLYSMRIKISYNDSVVIVSASPV